MQGGFTKWRVQLIWAPMGRAIVTGAIFFFVIVVGMAGSLVFVSAIFQTLSLICINKSFGLVYRFRLSEMGTSFVSRFLKVWKIIKRCNNCFFNIFQVCHHGGTLRSGNMWWLGFSLVKYIPALEHFSTELKIESKVRFVSARLQGKLTR